MRLWEYVVNTEITTKEWSSFVQKGCVIIYENLFCWIVRRTSDSFIYVKTLLAG